MLFFSQPPTLPKTASGVFSLIMESDYESKKRRAKAMSDHMLKKTIKTSGDQNLINAVKREVNQRLHIKRIRKKVDDLSDEFFSGLPGD